MDGMNGWMVNGQMDERWKVDGWTGWKEGRMNG
jgi:hypothetical protein